MGRKRKRSDFILAGVYDTETTNILDGSDAVAFPILYIYNDIRGCKLKNYREGSGSVSFYRNEHDFMERVRGIIEWGKSVKKTPIICAYNLMFDLIPLMPLLYDNYKLEVCAQSSANIYYMDIKEDKKRVLRFWDTFHLETNGLAAMGATCGLAKLTGDWDYNLVRTPDTPITKEEKGYAARDVEVIPCYLRFLMESNSWLREDMFGCKVVTRTSLVRQMARYELGNKRVVKSNGKKMGLLYSYEHLCKRECPSNWNAWAIRKASFRGGFTFTAANNAHKLWHDVLSLDVTSMHHAFIDGRFIPVHFQKVSPDYLDTMVHSVIETPLEDVLASYHKPFDVGFHACLKFHNMRLKEGTIFERDGIALIPRAKFTKVMDVYSGTSEADMVQEDYLHKTAYHSVAYGATFAFGKLMSAECVKTFVNEIEAWCIAQVYDFDSVTAVFGELSVNHVIPPDYVTLQSHLLYRRKDDMKHLCNGYTGEPYDGEIGPTVPKDIAEGCKQGILTPFFVEAYYIRTVKAMFNGIYGTQAMDEFKPDFLIHDAQISVNHATVCTKETFAKKKPKQSKVLYTYGMRIVGGSRQHLVIALMLLQKHMDKLHILGGDTDSVKVAIDDITPDGIIDALEPLHDAVTKAIAKTAKRLHDNFSEYASDLKGVGCFEVESAAKNSVTWENHIEFWNKARISQVNGHCHVTCAGLPRPDNLYNIENVVDILSEEMGFEEAVFSCLGYNRYISHDISHTLEHFRPKPRERYRAEVTDYRGVTTMVDAPSAIALKPAGRMLGDTTKAVNAENVLWLRHMGRPVDTETVFVGVRDGEPYTELA